MTETQKKRALNLREREYSYAKISKEIDVPESTIKSFFRRINHIPDMKFESICYHCGKQIEFVPHRKFRKFCSGKCRVAWWRLNNRKKKGKMDADTE